MDITQFGKGAIPDPDDDRDYRLPPTFGANAVDWTKPYMVSVPPSDDQANADCCVGEAWSYYHWQLTGLPFAVRSIFAYIAQAYGANIRDGGLRIKQFGQETLAERPDPKPKTPQNMRSKVGLDPEQAKVYTEVDSFSVPYSMDAIAQAVCQYKGVVFGVTGSNGGWHDMTVPRPPSVAETNAGDTWGHALYVMGYHLHTNTDGSIEKCLICKPSWAGVKEHHIRESYFNSGNVFNAWTLIPKEDSMTNSLIVKNGTEYGIFDPATSEDGLITLMRNRGMIVPLTAEGKLDWSQVIPQKELVDKA